MGPLWETWASEVKMFLDCTDAPIFNILKTFYAFQGGLYPNLFK